MTQAITADCVLTNQVIGEFLNVVRTKAVISPVEGRSTAADSSFLFPLLPTTADQLIAASGLSEQHRYQFWDAVILTVAASAGVEYLLTEDMQDGATVHGIRLLNPFNPANHEMLDALLTPVP